ncbi:MAG: SRPBCC family protein [Planctomycetes bacterium]|nr:SRPBCC family protein [Planctomycetota bacterium]
MIIKAQISINGSKEEVWEVITDIENSQSTITGIEKIEVLEKPTNGLVGLKWQETRTLFGKTATEIMWITDAKEKELYSTRAESHGAVYITNLVLSDQDHGTRLTIEFKGIPQTFGAKLMSVIMGFFFKSATKKALMQDLVDIKAVIEKTA